MIWIAAAAVVLGLPWPQIPPQVLPGHATRRLEDALRGARAHQNHVWRDTAPLNTDGSVNAYVEIGRGDTRKFEFDIALHRRRVDRLMPQHLAYPVNYGFVPQTISYDGDPFDALVLGPELTGGAVVRGTIVGLMHMEDEKGPDAKVVLAPVSSEGPARDVLGADDRVRLTDYFNRYKRHEPEKFSKVEGWGSEAQALAYLRTTHAFFRECRGMPGRPCRAR